MDQIWILAAAVGHPPKVLLRCKFQCLREFWYTPLPPLLWAAKELFLRILIYHYQDIKEIWGSVLIGINFWMGRSAPIQCTVDYF